MNFDKDKKIKFQVTCISNSVRRVKFGDKVNVLDEKGEYPDGYYLLLDKNGVIFCSPKRLYLDPK